ncbi:unnamed protein product [Amaranthus hypochondriacus]
MAVETEDLDNQPPISQATHINNGDIDEEPEENDEEEEEEDDDAIDEDDDEEEGSSLSKMKPNDTLIKDKMTKLVNRVRSEPIALRVHDVVIKGNLKTKDSVIEADILDELKQASTLQEIFQAAAIANLKLR